jgi:hypothetical protein
LRRLRATQINYILRRNREEELRESRESRGDRKARSLEKVRGNSEKHKALCSSSPSSPAERGDMTI